MKPLNLRSPKKFDYEQEAETESRKVYFYCVSEGPTEESYLWGIKNNRAELDIKNHIHIEVVEKAAGQENYSHPLQLVNACLKQMGRMDENDNLLEKEQWIECKWDNYDPSIDKICVIFDRDYRDLEDSLDTIYERCEEHDIDIVISNPNFELWLLMHFPDIEQYDREMLLENRKNLRHQLFEDASKNKKYLEILVAKNNPGYTKGSKIKFDAFLPLVEQAIAQSVLFSEDSKEVRNQLGTCVGKLLRTVKA